MSSKHVQIKPVSTWKIVEKRDVVLTKADPEAPSSKTYRGVTGLTLQT